MKTALAIVCFSLLSAGCTSTRVSQHPLRQVMADYRSIQQGMTEEQVVGILGAPDEAENSGNFTLHWWQDIPGSNSDRYAQIDVSFDEEGRVSEARITTGVDHFDPGPAAREAMPIHPVTSPMTGQ